MKVYRPTDNPITQDYRDTHRAYDFAGLNLPDNVRSGKDGEIIERVDIHVGNWINSGKLTIRDYGNYIKVKHTDGTYALYAHLRKGSSYLVGTKITAGQTIARIGNTGNSTGPHLHVEYRNASNANVPVVFYANQGDSSQAIIDELRKERDDNWNLYTKTLQENKELKFNKEVAEKINQEYAKGVKELSVIVDKLLKL